MFRILVSAAALAFRGTRAVRSAGLLVATGALLLGACAQLPREPLTAQPMTAAPAPRTLPAATAGSIYNPSYGDRPLFEDPRPRQIGDVLTIVINENVNATKSSATNTSRAGNASFTPTTTPGLLRGLFGSAGTSMSGDNVLKASGGANAQNTFTGTLTVTVTQVLANGNLAVSGEKQMLINQGREFIRFSGVVNPTTITGANTVYSTQVADARIEYSAKGYIDEAQTMGWLQRFFLNISPF
ncbi:flagellar basal body L-ring protein FlgH [Chitinasiproducens palmae]|uniref:Flagellar L-ring protein n=1 Tax=Chitinasiproducens palmae TaxID=1770053 RepID=A0A1H2PJP8_9BURK|nr:flagellar basal body L-ring protein FlgH [Chitinasiproducens palmae]SDV46603.1 flagellar L-ring protein precursor FlgH [Chitinasiproducens palmae]